MLKIELPEFDSWDDNKQEFITKPKQVIRLEHSLLSVSKWESKWKIPFLDNSPKTYEMTIDYFRCMCIDDPDELFDLRITEDNVRTITSYIEDPMTASWITTNEQGSRTKITSDLIYYWMVSASIPFEAERWHLNRLIMLIRICGEKNRPEKKMSQRDLAERNRRLNEQRRREMRTNG